MTADTVARKLAEILARIARVRELLPPTPEELASRRTEGEALILNLYLALQGCADLALHAVADRGLGVPGDARGAYTLLVDADLLDRVLARRLAAAIGLRNRIAHEYARLDLVLVHGAARDGLGDLEAFAAQIARIYGLEGG